MEMGIANDLKIIYVGSLKRVKDGIKDGDIPDWLLLELFIRLPQKVIFRLKLVSKQWLSIISYPSFIKMYCSRVLSIQKLQPWTFVLNSRYFHLVKKKHIPDWELLVDIYSGNHKWPNLDVLPLPCFPHIAFEKCYKIYGNSKGLVLYGPYKFTEGLNYRICNPVTGQWIALPPLGFCQGFASSWGFMTNVEYGVLMSYTVVRLCVPDMCQRKLIICKVFLSEVGEWKTYNVPIDKVIGINNSCAVLNGVMHWLLHDEKGLIAYDPHKSPDQVHFIPLPVSKKVKHFTYICAAYQGLLRYFKVSDINIYTITFESFNIWVLCDYTSGVWCLQHRVNYIDVQLSTVLSGGLIIPIAFHPYDSDIVYLVCGKKIILYNIQTRKLEASETFRQVRAAKFYNIFATHLFLIPPWPVSLSRLLPVLQGNS